MPSVLQVGLLWLLATEASSGWLEQLFGISNIRGVVLLLIACEGLFGGYSYVSAFSRLSSGDEETQPGLSQNVLLARKEFRMGCALSVLSCASLAKCRYAAASALRIRLAFW